MPHGNSVNTYSHVDKFPMAKIIGESIGQTKSSIKTKNCTWLI